MKTRSGEVVFLEDVLDEARARMLHNRSQSKSTKEAGTRSVHFRARRHDMRLERL